MLSNYKFLAVCTFVCTSGILCTVQSLSYLVIFNIYDLSCTQNVRRNLCVDNSSISSLCTAVSSSWAILFRNISMNLKLKINSIPHQLHFLAHRILQCRAGVSIFYFQLLVYFFFLFNFTFQILFPLLLDCNLSDRMFLCPHLFPSS